MSNANSKGSTTDNKAEGDVAEDVLGTRSRWPQWVRDGLTRRSLTLLVRAWVVSWASFVLLLPGPSLRALGQAAFFASIVSFMLPASLPTVVYFLASVMVAFGAALGWAWGVAALAAGLRARDHVIATEAIERVRTSAAQSPNPDVYYQTAVFQGEFLDARTSVVVGVFFIIGCYAMGYLQACRPQLKIAAVFATILLDINCAYGVLFPNGYYTFGKILFYPLGCAIGIGVAAHIVVFPESFAYIWQLDLCKLLELNEKLLLTHRNILHRVVADPQSATSIEHQRTPVVRALQNGLATKSNEMKGQQHFLQLDVSCSHFTPRDLASIFDTIRSSNVRLFGLDAFIHLVAQHHNTPASGTDDAKQTKTVTLADTHLLLHVHHQWTQSEAILNVSLEKMLSLLGEMTQTPLQTANESLSVMRGWIDATAHLFRKYDHDAWLGKLESSLDALKAATDVFTTSDRLALLKPYEELFRQDAQGASTLSGEAGDAFRRSARPLFICSVFVANLSNYLTSLIKTHEAILNTARKRTKRRLRLPTLGFGKLIRVLNSKSGSGDDRPDQQSPVLADRYSTADVDEESTAASGESNAASTDIEKDGKRDVQVPKKRQEAVVDVVCDPDALPPTRAIHYVGRFLANAHSAFWSPEGAYALRYAIVSFALWLPSVFKNSAYFAYIHRSIWALIMAQTGLALFGGEMIFSLITRLLGTCAGLVLGMLYWYISCGNAARGNAYGLGAVTAIGFIPLVFLRLFAPPILLMFTIMLCVTTALALGYSWIDTHIFQLANSGKGVDVAWRRALLVLIGMAAAIIVTLFPRPPSTRESVRRGFAKSTKQIARLYSTIIEGWITVESSAEGEANQDFLEIIRPRYLDTLAILGLLQRDIGLSAFDMSFRGAWPKAQYVELLDIHIRLMQSIAQMTGSLIVLDGRWQQRMLYTTAILDPLTISDICVTLSLLANALQTGDPLPHAFTPLLETTLHHQGMARAVERSIARQGLQEDHDSLTIAMLRDPQFMQHTAGVMALIAFVRQLDRFRAVVRTLVGEHALPGFDTIKARFDQRLVKAHLE